MAGIFKVTRLEEKKRALTAESEIYRQTLKLEIQNLRLYGAKAKRKFAFVLAARPFLMTALPWAASIIRRRPRRKMGIIKLSFLGWRIYRQISPFLRLLRGVRADRQVGRKSSLPEDRVSAANI